jgi:uncharacterized ion transporter superfamily protein YfcC
MMVAGVLTIIVPAGSYTHIEVDGRQSVDPNSFQIVDKPDYPIWRWFTAPIEVLGSESGLTVIVIIVVLFFAGGAFAVLEKTGTIRAFIGGVVRKFRDRKYLLLYMVCLAFMFLGATLGTFEEVVLLVPVMIALSYSLGWDALVGLGMSILATNMGFSAAISNPYTLGVSQQLAGLPLFSGAWLRIIIFAVIYFIFTAFLVSYARKIDKDPKASLVHGEDTAEREKYKSMQTKTRDQLLRDFRSINLPNHVGWAIRPCNFRLRAPHCWHSLPHRRAWRGIHIWRGIKNRVAGTQGRHYRSCAIDPINPNGGQHSLHH